MQPHSTVTAEGEKARPLSRRQGVKLWASPKWWYWGLLGVAFAISIFLSATLNIWTDEAFTLETTARGPLYAFRQAVAFELQAPVYFVLLSLWRTIDGSIFFARLFSALCAFGVLLIAASISRRLFRDLDPGWIVLLLAVNPYFLWAATEIRLYAFALLLSSLLILFFLRGYVADERHRLDRPAYLLVAIIALYTQYYLGFILVANALCLVVLQRWRPLRAYLIGMGLVALAFCPMLTYVKAQVTSQTGGAREVTSYFRALDLTAWRSKELVLPAQESWAIELRKWLIRIAYLLLAVLAVRHRYKLLSETNRIAWGLFGACALMFSIAIAVTSEGMLLPRHMVALFIPAIILVLSLLTLTRRSLVRISVLTLLVGFSVAAAWASFKSGTKFGNWNQVAAYLQSHERQGEPILVFHGGAALPLKYHYGGRNQLVPMPADNRFDTFDITRYVLRGDAQISERVSKFVSSDGIYWLVSDNVCSYLGVDYNCGMLDRYVASHFNVHETLVFGTTTVRKLSTREGTAR